MSHWQKTKLKRVQGNRKKDIESHFESKDKSTTPHRNNTQITHGEDNVDHSIDNSIDKEINQTNNTSITKKSKKQKRE